ncbi:hypothetical protein GR160_06180 [Flavobacterium sp. Sd200]|uniref:hypothetical protein n=1 Tax=Flavobacterium sp. Sd200 TaxID=2692211 RepID=UPI00136EF046|nr:hypothetical protein [Flavobacterium sp. Sd200]MXN90809.1 hypothetical protein [Flavobacterium sp. Sd200]
MKALEKLNNVEKGRLLAGWFPELLPELVDTIKGAQEYLAENETEVRQQWDNGFFNVDFWLRLSATVGKIIDLNGKRLAKHPRLFAEELFDGYNALFTIDCIDKYKFAVHNVKFTQAVRLLFDRG